MCFSHRGVLLRNVHFCFSCLFVLVTELYGLVQNFDSNPLLITFMPLFSSKMWLVFHLFIVSLLYKSF